jgi:hypothetical protein
MPCNLRSSSFENAARNVSAIVFRKEPENRRCVTAYGLNGTFFRFLALALRFQQNGLKRSVGNKKQITP